MTRFNDIFPQFKSTADSAIRRLEERISELEHEILHLRQHEQTISRNNHVFEALLSKNQGGIVLVSPDMTIFRLVHSALGYDEVDMLGRSVLSVIHPDDSQRCGDAFLRVIGGNVKTDRCELRARQSDGCWRWHLLEMTDMLDDPDVQAVVFNYRDITAEQTLRAGAAMLESLRSSPEYAIFSLCLDGTIRDWNAGAEAMFGYSASEAIEQCIDMLVPASLIQGDCDHRERVRRGESLAPYDTVRLRKNGREIGIRVKIAPILDAQGTVAAIAHLSHAI